MSAELRAVRLLEILIGIEYHCFGILDCFISTLPETEVKFKFLDRKIKTLISCTPFVSFSIITCPDRSARENLEG